LFRSRRVRSPTVREGASTSNAPSLTVGLLTPSARLFQFSDQRGCMNLVAIFINPETRLLRSGWRMLVFMILVSIPNFFFTAENSTFEIGWRMIASYVVWVIWVGLVSWVCLKFLDRLSFGALGLMLHRGWQREVLLGCVVSAVMMT